MRLSCKATRQRTEKKQAILVPHITRMKDTRLPPGHHGLNTLLFQLRFGNSMPVKSNQIVNPITNGNSHNIEHFCILTKK